MPIEDALRKLAAGVLKSENLVVAVDFPAGQLESAFLAPRRRRHVVDSVGARLDAQVLVGLRLALQRGLTRADHDVAFERKPFLAELALVHLAFPAAGEPRECLQYRRRGALSGCGTR